MGEACLGDSRTHEANSSLGKRGRVMHSRTRQSGRPPRGVVSAAVSELRGPGQLSLVLLPPGPVPPIPHGSRNNNGVSSTSVRLRILPPRLGRCEFLPFQAPLPLVD